ncbi:MAG: hypothetical protein R3E86_04640 [Pseudomonadales bacterium]
MPERDPDLIQRMGGPAVIDRLVDELYAEVLLDDRIADFFSGCSVARLAERQRRFLLALLQGPELPADLDLAAAHAPLVARGLNDSHIDALLELMERALAAIGADTSVSTLLLQRLERFRQVVLGVPSTVCGADTEQRSEQAEEERQS